MITHGQFKRLKPGDTFKYMGLIYVVNQGPRAMPYGKSGRPQTGIVATSPSFTEPVEFFLDHNRGTMTFLDEDEIEQLEASTVVADFESFLEEL